MDPKRVFVAKVGVVQCLILLEACWLKTYDLTTNLNAHMKLLRS